MENRFSLDLEMREVVGKKVKRLRRQGLLPATVYGKNVAPLTVQLDERAFSNFYRHAGRTSLVELNIPGQAKMSAFIQDIQRHPVSRDIIHADFRVVNLREKMHVEVPIVLTGESPLVERGDAVVNQTLSMLEIRALPTDVPQHIEVDIGMLDDFEKSIHVSDLPVSARYEILSHGDELIVTLTQTRAALAEGEQAEAEPVGGAAEPKLIREEREQKEAEE